MSDLAEQVEQISNEVNLAFNELAEAAKRLDHDQYFSRFNKSSFSSLNSDGSVLHRFSDFKELYLSQTKVVAKYHSLEFKKVQLDVVTADVVVLVNEYSAEVLLTSGQVVVAEGGGTQVWSKTTGKWLLVNVSSSTKPVLEVSQ